MGIFFVYAVYEIMLIMCILCTTSVFSPSPESIVVVSPTMGLTNAYSSPYNNTSALT
jgi:hypothetical protein